MKRIAKFVNMIPALLSLVVIPFSYLSPVYADVLSDRLGDVTSSTNESDLISSILGVAIPVAIMALVGLSAYAGFLMLTSQGNPEKLSEAREVISNALTGFGLIVLSIALLLIIQSVLNIPGVNP